MRDEGWNSSTPDWQTARKLRAKLNLFAKNLKLKTQIIVSISENQERGSVSFLAR
jgi:hypothetical protein